MSDRLGKVSDRFQACVRYGSGRFQIEFRSVSDRFHASSKLVSDASQIGFKEAFRHVTNRFQIFHRLGFHAGVTMALFSYEPYQGVELRGL